LERVLADPTATLDLVIVGGGAAGTEVALNVTGRFVGEERRSDLTLTIIEQDAQVLPGFPDGMKRHAARLLRNRGATIRSGTTVDAVASTDGDGMRVEATSDRGGTDTLRPDVVLWATGSVGPSLLRESGLSTDDQGFLHVDRTLRTPTHPRIFAAGDCATIRGLELDKVGVHAVKQGPLLRRNIDRSLKAMDSFGTPPAGTALKSFRPYPVAPLLLSTGAPEALWTAGPLWAAHPWLLRLKHWIDRRWIRTYAPEQWGSAGWRALLGGEAASGFGGAR
jgi:selenide,water dikinase